MPVSIKQLFEPVSSTYTYLLACTKTKQAVLIDPVLETVDRDLNAVDEAGLTLVLAINTHCHADHVTGTNELKKCRPGVKSGIAEASTARADIHYRPGDTIPVGESATLHVLATPGHTSGCVSYYLPQATASGEPGAVFTGDALLINGCGRTDFQGGSSEQLYRSVHSQSEAFSYADRLPSLPQLIFTLPGSTVVYPAHDYKGLTSSTVQQEKENNPRLSRPLEDFVQIMADLNLPYPNKIDIALPANLLCGVQEA